MLKEVLYIGAGSFLGGVFRYLLSLFIKAKLRGSFPWDTLLVNLLGCFAIGLLMGLFEHYGVLKGQIRLFLTVGLCGGFTTYSTFMFDSLSLLKSDNLMLMLLYIVLSVVLGFLLVFLGYEWLK